MNYVVKTLTATATVGLFLVASTFSVSAGKVWGSFCDDEITHVRYGCDLKWDVNVEEGPTCNDPGAKCGYDVKTRFCHNIFAPWYCKPANCNYIGIKLSRRCRDVAHASGDAIDSNCICSKL